MLSAWTFSALRPEELARPMPTGEELDPMWRLMKPSAREAVASEDVLDVSDLPTQPGRPEPSVDQQGVAHAQ